MLPTQSSARSPCILRHRCQWRVAEFTMVALVNMPWYVRTGPESARCYTDSGPAYYGVSVKTWLGQQWSYNNAMQCHNYATQCCDIMQYMMTSSNGNIFRVTGPLYGEFTGHRRIPLTKASDAELSCFLWSAPWIKGWVNNREAGDLWVKPGKNAIK